MQLYCETSVYPLYLKVFRMFFSKISVTVVNDDYDVEVEYRP